MARYGRLRLEKHPVHGLVLSTTDRPVLEEVLRAKKIAGMLGDAARRRHRRGAPQRARQPQAGAAQARLAGRGLRRATSTARRTPSTLAEDGWTLRPYQREAAESFWHGGSGVVVLPCGAGKTIVGAAAMAHAQATTLILVTNTVSARQWKDELVAPHVADRGRDRRVLRRRQGDPAGHHRDLPGADDQAEGRLPAPRAARRPRLGPHRLRRGAPAARADLPDDRRPAGAAAARPDRDAGARGRPRGRGLLADRARSATTPRGRTSRRRATSRPPTASRCGSRLPDGERLAYATGDPEDPLPPRLVHPRTRSTSSTTSCASTPASRPW